MTHVKSLSQMCERLETFTMIHTQDEDFIEKWPYFSKCNIMKEVTSLLKKVNTNTKRYKMIE